MLDFFKTKATAGGAPAGAGVSTSKPLAAACNDQKRRMPTQPGGGSSKKTKMQVDDFFTPRLHTGPQVLTRHDHVDDFLQELPPSF